MIAFLWHHLGDEASGFFQVNPHRLPCLLRIAGADPIYYRGSQIAVMPSRHTEPRWKTSPAMSGPIRYLILFFTALGIAMAQVSSATITGRVQDASGAAVQGAKVTIVQQATSESRDLLTNDRGEFNAPNLHIGRYSVTVTMHGFKTQIFNGITLEIDKVLNLPVTLQPGVITESVEVTGGAPLVDTATSSLGHVFDKKQIIDLPLNGRNV